MKIAIVDDENFFLEYLDQAMKDRLSKIGISIEQLDLFHSADEFLRSGPPESTMSLFWTSLLIRTMA